jgi:hypothetical protein
MFAISQGSLRVEKKIKKYFPGSRRVVELKLRLLGFAQKHVLKLSPEIVIFLLFKDNFFNYV